jgi:hypothetical protein
MSCPVGGNAQLPTGFQSRPRGAQWPQLEAATGTTVR